MFTRFVELFFQILTLITIANVTKSIYSISVSDPLDLSKTFLFLSILIAIYSIFLNHLPVITESTCEIRKEILNDRYINTCATKLASEWKTGINRIMLLHKQGIYAFYDYYNKDVKMLIETIKLKKDKIKERN